MNEKDHCDSFTSNAPFSRTCVRLVVSFLPPPQNPRRIHRTSAAVLIQKTCPFVTGNQQLQVTTAGGSSTPASAPVDGHPEVGEGDVCGRCSGSTSQAESGEGLLSFQMPV